MEYSVLEPWGPLVDDMRHGALCATFLAPYMKKGAAADPRDYMFGRLEERELTPEETVAVFRTALGGAVRDP